MVTENIKFYSITCRLWKLKDLEDACENYGHIAVYKGGIMEAPFSFTLDKEHVFEKDKPERICGNTAKMLADTRFGKYFNVTGSFKKHFGIFKDCSTENGENTIVSGPAIKSCC